jgi:uncharacterized membrane protein YdbT with pleckstrin-like domain
VSDAARRAAVRRGLRLHLLLALTTTMALIVVNVLTTPSYPWWMWVAVAWGAPLAVHVAIAMELFRSRN